MRKGPFRVIVCIITLWSFLFNTVGLHEAWAARSPLELTSVDSNRPGGPMASLDIETFTLPAYLGRIKDRYETGSNKVVIHVQDAHCNYAAQHKIAEILKLFNDKYGIDMANLEGGAGEYDLSIFTRIQKSQIREKVADYFVKEGLVNGAEYFAINNPEEMTLWGVEEPKLYLENLNIYRESLKHKETIDKYLKELTHIVKNLKRRIYSKELLELDEKYTQFKSEAIEFKDYLSYLIGKAGSKEINIAAFANIELLNKSLEQEKTINFKKANYERSEIIERLERTLSKNELKELVLKTFEYKSEKIIQKDYYSYLIIKAKSVNLDIKDFPELQRFIAYISTYNAIDKPKLMGELDDLEKRVRASLYENDKQKELSLLAKNLILMDNIFNIRLTKDDYKYYIDNKHTFNIGNYISFINKEAPLYHIKTALVDDINELDEYRENLSRFYEYSFKRDQAFLDNLKFSSGKHKTAILVTGGFHSENLCQLFKERDMSYISITPNFKNDNGYESPYFRLLSGRQNEILDDLLPEVSAMALFTDFCKASGLVNGELTTKARHLWIELVEWSMAGDGFMVRGKRYYTFKRSKGLEEITAVNGKQVFARATTEEEAQNAELQSRISTLSETSSIETTGRTSTVDEQKEAITEMIANLPELEQLYGEGEEGAYTVQSVAKSALIMEKAGVDIAVIKKLLLEGIYVRVKDMTEKEQRYMISKIADIAKQIKTTFPRVPHSTGAFSESGERFLLNRLFPKYQEHAYSITLAISQMLKDAEVEKLEKILVKNLPDIDYKAAIAVCRIVSSDSFNMFIDVIKPKDDSERNNLENFLLLELPQRYGWYAFEAVGAAATFANIGKDFEWIRDWLLNKVPEECHPVMYLLRSSIHKVLDPVLIEKITNSAQYYSREEIETILTIGMPMQDWKIQSVIKAIRDNPQQEEKRIQKEIRYDVISPWERPSRAELSNYRERIDDEDQYAGRMAARAEKVGSVMGSDLIGRLSQIEGVDRRYAEELAFEKILNYYFDPLLVIRAIIRFNELGMDMPKIEEFMFNTLPAKFGCNEYNPTNAQVVLREAMRAASSDIIDNWVEKGLDRDKAIDIFIVQLSVDYEHGREVSVIAELADEFVTGQSWPDQSWMDSPFDAPRSIFRRGFAEIGVTVDQVVSALDISVEEIVETWIVKASEKHGKHFPSVVSAALRVAEGGYMDRGRIEHLLLGELKVQAAQRMEISAKDKVVERLVASGVERQRAINFILVKMPEFWTKDEKPSRLITASDPVTDYGNFIVLLADNEIGIDEIEVFMTDRLREGRRGLHTTIYGLEVAESGTFEEMKKAGISGKAATEFLLMEIPCAYGQQTKEIAASIADIVKPLCSGMSQDESGRLINMISKRLPINDSLVKEVSAAVREGLTSLPKKRLLQFLNASDESRTLDTMLLDANHNPVFDHINPFIATLDEAVNTRFINNVFVQVARDKGVDSNGTVSHQRLWQIIQLLQNVKGSGADWKERIINSDIEDPTFIGLRGELLEKDKWCSSWKQFQRLRVLVNLINHDAMLAKIQGYLDGTAEEQTLYNYYRFLILHSAMNDYNALEKMIMNPAEFLGLRDANTPQEIHDAKKPSRLLELNHIDLTARELVDGLILGKFNSLQALRPFSTTISMTDIDQEIGKLKGGRLITYLKNAGYASEDSLTRILKTFFANEIDIMTRAQQQDQFVDQKRWRLANEARELLQDGASFESVINKTRGFRFDTATLIENGLELTSFTVRIIPKSEPQAIMTGSEAPSCMAFGSGKNNIYIFNPNTAFLALSKEIIGEDGEKRERILATSVITLDRKIPINVADLRGIIEGASQQGKLEEVDLQEVLGEDFIDKISPDAYISADNIEGATDALLRTHGGMEFGRIVRIAYKNLFEEYSKQHHTTTRKRPLNKSRVAIGTAHSHFIEHFPDEEDNFYLMQAPVAYSDKTTEKIRILPLEASTKVKDVTEPLDGVLPLSYEDTLEVAYIENTAFKGKEYKNHLAGIEMELIGAAYNEALKGDKRKNLSLGYFEKGKLLGYIIAYVGYDIRREQEVIYISDFAVLHKGGIAAGKMLQQLFASIQNTADMFKTEYSQEISVLFQATTAKDGSFWLFMPRDGDSNETKERKKKRLKNHGLSIAEEKDLGGGRIECLLKVVSPRVSITAGQEARTSTIAPEEQVVAIHAITDDLRTNTADIIVMPGSQLHKGLQYGVSRQLAEDLRMKDLVTIPLHYPYTPGTWQDMIRDVLLKALQELDSRVKQEDDTARALIYTPKGGREFVKGILKEAVFDQRRDRFSIVDLDGVQEEGIINVRTHIMLAKALLNYERGALGDEAQRRLINLMKTVISNPGQVDDQETIKKILAGTLALRMIKPRDINEFRDQEKAYREIERAL